MTMIYRLEFESQLSLIETADYTIFKAWKNPQPIMNWQPVRVQYDDESTMSDMMGLRAIMVWHSSVVDKHSSSDYQALPIQLDDAIYYAIHITNVNNCLDADRSQFKRFKNRNIGVEHYVFRAGCIGDAMLFTIPDDGYSAIFASGEFKTWFDANGWTGLSFLSVEMTV